VPWQRWTAYTVATIAVAADLLAWVWGLAWLGSSAVLPLLVTSLVLLPVIALGVLVATRRPANPVGALLVGAGTMPIFVALEWVVGEVHTQQPGAIRVLPALVAADQGSWMWLYVPGALLMLVFPDGHLIGPRWRWVVWGLLVVPVSFGVAAALYPAPFRAPFEDVPRGDLPALPAWAAAVPAAVLLLAFAVLLLASAASMIIRRRRSRDPVLRAQLRWFALGALFLPVALLLCWLSYLLIGSPDLGFLVLAATPVVLALATTIGLLRHDLYDVDRALSVAVMYAIVSAVLVGVFATVNIALGLLVGRGSAPAAAAATAVCAVALAPLRSRLQRSVRRRIDPRRAEVLDALGTLRSRADSGVEPPEVLETVLRASLHDPGLRVGFQVPGHAGLVDTAGEPVGITSAGAVPVHLGDARIGVLVPGHPTASRELLREVAHEVAPLVEVIRLRRELAGAIHEVELSRRRLLVAGYEERRRLQRDLHDGAQQRLVSLGMSLRLAQRHLPPGNEDLDGLIDQAVAELGTSVAELRAISHGLGPTTVGGGLAPALHSLASSLPLTVDLELDCDEVPDEVVTTAYYVASEALANTIKHASAGHVSVAAQRVNGSLTVTVRDDGRGGASPAAGSGLAGLADRVAAAGGRLEVDSVAGLGTTVRAVIPCAS
jgi:signal transduction histidine kinase